MQQLMLKIDRHFKLRSDELAVAQYEGTLHRNFQDYSAHSDCDSVARNICMVFDRFIDPQVKDGLFSRLV